jgi:hypothetical protein
MVENPTMRNKYVARLERLKLGVRATRARVMPNHVGTSHRFENRLRAERRAIVTAHRFGNRSPRSKLVVKTDSQPRIDRIIRHQPAFK